mgnify:CR=1 FL=1
MSIPSKERKLNIIRIAPADFGRVVLALIFLAAIYYFVGHNPSGLSNGSTLLVVAAVIGGYMAMNIGANDVANNVGPAVGSQAITLTGAILIAVICESAGALIAGGDVVSTIKKGIIDPAFFKNDVDTFIWAMTAALLAAALWLNLATYLGAPVSTTHSIVGGVLGAGIAAGGWSIANWDKVQQIVASWIISPALGGLIAAAFLYLIKVTILYKEDMIAASKNRVPILLGIMGWAFTTYIVLKGTKKLIKIEMPVALMLGGIVAVIVFFVTRPMIVRASANMKNDEASIDNLFTIPLIVGACFLSFAHGANDVANAIGPLAAINEAVRANAVVATASIPLWVMIVGALGIAVGLGLYGPKLVKTVGTEITELDKNRAFCVSLAAAITVIIATHFGLPVSSTHIAVGAIFGVGFLREILVYRYNQRLDQVREYMDEEIDQEAAERFLEAFDQATMPQKKQMLAELKGRKRPTNQRKRFKKAYREKLVQRSLLVKIVLAWIITVPLSGIFAAMLFYMIKGFMLSI